MSFQFKPAEKVGLKIFLGIAGPTGSGKTYSALLIAQGLVGHVGKIFVLDTENGRALHYADRFQFMHGHFSAPYSPARYLEAIEAAVAAGAECVVVDSASHMHEGEGGVLEMQAAEHARMGGKDSTKFASWIKPKGEFKKFVIGVMQLNVHVIFCFRAREKLAMVKVMKNGREVNEPVNTGWAPICTNGLDYEMTALLTLPPNAKGVPAYGTQHEKMPIYLQDIFKPGQALSVDTGRALAQWASSSMTMSKPVQTEEDAIAAQLRRDQEIEELLGQARARARMGLEHLRDFYRQQSRQDKAELDKVLEELKALVPMEMGENGK